jgi:uncharacterized protein YqhQ
MSNENSCIHRTSIGGQAIMEGVMMRGPEKTVIAVRNPQGEIVLEDLKDEAKYKKLKKIPIIRGIFNFISSLTVGFAAINRSTEIALSEEELQPDKFDLWVEKHFGDKAGKIITGVTMVIGVVLALGLFVFLPYGAMWGIEKLTGWNSGGWFYLIEGLIRILIFISYIALVRQMKEIKRLFAYHGAEHKTIHCYEHGEELTVENAARYTTLHKRCGTNFLVIVMLISILVFSFIRPESQLLRLGLRILLLPVVAGISYEFIKLFGRFDNWFTTLLSWPGLMLQKLTTANPDEGQLEVAIASLKAVIPENKDDAKW